MAKSKHNVLHWLLVVVLRIIYLAFWVLIGAAMIYIALNQKTPAWRLMVIGLPLGMMGISIFLIVLFNFLQALFNLQYNRTHCPFCSRKES